MARVKRSAHMFLQITSFGGVDLEKKFPSSTSARHDHLPIAPSKTHPDNGVLLILDDPSYQLRKKSYVKTRKRQSIRLASLQPYNRRGPDIFLSERSCQTLIQHIQFTEPPYQLPPVILPPVRSISVRQSSAADDSLLLSNSYTRYLEASRAYRAQISAQDSSNITISSAERQPLLPTSRVNPPHHYGRHNTLPTTYEIQQSYGSSKPFDWNKFWKCVGIVLCICLASLISYGLYLGACWVIAACGRALDWVKEESGSAWEMIKSAWASLRQSLEL
ncbi:hypothetical protein F4825DRAFT_407751 [Nemania diffusa]|nr:hypothetical protein F4825DRAFT_407751 [Nemania diffusa]